MWWLQPLCDTAGKSSVTPWKEQQQCVCVCVCVCLWLKQHLATSSFSGTKCQREVTVWVSVCFLRWTTHVHLNPVKSVDSRHWHVCRELWLTGTPLGWSLKPEQQVCLTQYLKTSNCQDNWKHSWQLYCFISLEVSCKKYFLLSVLSILSRLSITSEIISVWTEHSILPLHGES